MPAALPRGTRSAWCPGFPMGDLPRRPRPAASALLRRCRERCVAGDLEGEWQAMTHAACRVMPGGARAHAGLSGPLCGHSKALWGRSGAPRGPERPRASLLRRCGVSLGTNNDDDNDDAVASKTESPCPGEGQNMGNDTPHPSRHPQLATANVVRAVQ